jgi:hypothetical protein
MLQSAAAVIAEQGVGVPVQDVLDHEQSYVASQSVADSISAQGVGVPVQAELDQ